jgi:N-acetylglucosaminyldiphosphoundecaprenol N-acetyl-beta-D-mannosaminyltransferase
MHTKKCPLVFLGVPLSNLTMEETVSKIIELIEDYKKDLQPRYIATLNADFLVQSNQWNFGEARFPELLHTLRQASIVTTDGMPILWACRAMGSYVKERVTGSDLLPKLSEALSEHKKSVFLLGGSEKTLKLCTLYLQALYPDLTIAGTAHLQIDIKGEALDRAATRDTILIEQINRSNADLLFINLGNPKQEVWFERVKNQLHVPVSIGIGGAFDLLTGTISRAPIWMQKSGLEWSYRLMQEPKRLWKRYFVDLFKFTYMVLPPLIFHNLNRLVYKIFYQKQGAKIKLKSSLLFISTYHTIALIPLPSRLTPLVSDEIKNNLDDLFSQDALIFDFINVRHLDLEGVWLLLYISQRVKKEKRQFFLLNVSGDIRLLLKLHRVWDTLEDSHCNSSKGVITQLHQNGNSTSFFYDAIQQEQHLVIISFFGRLDNANNYEEYLKKLKPIIYQKDCILDFKYCYYIDNTGFQFLLELQDLQKEHFISLKICGLNKSLSRQFEITDVSNLFERRQKVNHGKNSSLLP